MPLWTHYNPDEFGEKNYSVLKEDDYRVRIDEVEETFTHKEPVRSMLKITLSVSGHNSKLWYYIVLDDSDDEAIMKTNNTLHKFFNCFGISNHTMDITEWEGKIGGVRVKHSEFQGTTRAEVAYLLYADKVAKLPDWQEGSGGSINSDMVNCSDDSKQNNPFGIPF